MPHVTDFRATPDHDRHDLLLVAALAGGDLAAHDRDLALHLTRTCAACAELHDDLVAIARATASVPPPIAARTRDFRLTPADAARLQRSGVGGFLASLTGLRSAATRPLGVGLATLGLVGLLIGNIPLQLGSSGAASPQAAGGLPAAANDYATEGGAKGAASGAPAYVTGADPAASAAASSQAELSNPGAGGAAAPSASSLNAGAIPAPSGAVRSAVGDTAGQASGAPVRDVGAPVVPQSTSNPADGPFRPLNLLFGMAVVAGLGLLVLSRRGHRSEG